MLRALSASGSPHLTKTTLRNAPFQPDLPPCIQHACSWTALLDFWIFLDNPVLIWAICYGSKTKHICTRKHMAPSKGPLVHFVSIYTEKCIKVAGSLASWRKLNNISLSNNCFDIPKRPIRAAKCIIIIRWTHKPNTAALACTPITWRIRMWCCRMEIEHISIMICHVKALIQTVSPRVAYAHLRGDSNPGPPVW